MYFLLLSVYKSFQYTEQSPSTPNSGVWLDPPSRGVGHPDDNLMAFPVLVVRCLVLFAHCGHPWTFPLWNFLFELLFCGTGRCMVVDVACGRSFAVFLFDEEVRRVFFLCSLCWCVPMLELPFLQLSFVTATFYRSRSLSLVSVRDSILICPP